MMVISVAFTQQHLQDDTKYIGQSVKLSILKLRYFICPVTLMIQRNADKTSFIMYAKQVA